MEQSCSTVGGGGGAGLKDDHWTIDPRGLDCWTFEEPVDPEDVTGISWPTGTSLCETMPRGGALALELPRQTDDSQTP